MLDLVGHAERADPLVHRASAGSTRNHATMQHMDRDGLAAWVAAYEEAWRSPGTDRLTALFTPEATYQTEPYAEPVRGLEAIASFWEDEREGPLEAFAVCGEVLAVDGDVGVDRVEVHYGEPVRQEYRDLWVLRTDETGRCSAFEEWPFWPGHGRSLGTADAGERPAGYATSWRTMSTPGRRRGPDARRAV